MATSVVFSRVQFFANNGRPLIGGRIHTYVAGSSTRAPTYKDASRAQPNANPIILDGRGEASIYLDIGVEYKFVVEDSKGALLLTQEPVYGAIWPDAASWPSDATLAYQYMLEAKAAAGAIGPLKFYSTYAQALADIANVPLDGLVEISVDETKDGARTRYFKRTGDVFEFAVNLDQIRLDLATAGGAQRIGLPPTAIVASIQAAFDSAETHKITLQPGVYPIDGATLRIFNKNQNTRRGEYVVDLTGVEFQGSGTIIIDSCKRLKIKGLFAPNWDIDLRGVWWSCFEDCMYRRTYTGRAGTLFSENYWNTWIGGVSQAVIVPADAVGNSNRFTWINHSLRGDATQGFSTTEQYAFQFLSGRQSQHWVFNGDISYHTLDVFNVDMSFTNDIELDLDVYWDTKIPIPPNRRGVRIKTKGHHANGSGLYMALNQALKTPVDISRQDRILTNTPESARNMVFNGDFREDMGATWAGANYPFSTVSGASVTWASGGLSGGYLQISQPNISNNSISAVARGKDFAGPYTAVWIVRNRDVGERDIRVSIGGLNFVTAKINDVEPTVITLNAIAPQGTSTFVSGLFADGAGFNVDVLYVGISMGTSAPLMLPSVRRKEVRQTLPSAGVTVPANGSINETFTLPGVAVGDLIFVSTDTGSLWVKARATSANQVQVMWENGSGSPVSTAGRQLYFVATQRQISF